MENENRQFPEPQNKRCKQIQEYLANPTDIKFEGPLSYRYLRIIAWIYFFIAQVVFVIGISSSFFGWEIISKDGYNVLKSLSGLSTPLFIIASFGLILGRQKNHKHFLILYGSAFIGLGVLFVLIYHRYIFGFYTHYNDLHGLTIITNRLKEYADINFFADLFMLSLFCFFINYNPKKFFIGKKTIVFRLMAIIPALYVVISYMLKMFYEFNVTEISIYVMPFLTTKSPLVFMIFIAIALWIKGREISFLKAGATKQDYLDYLKTNKNSLAFSIHLSMFILIFASIELTLYVVLGVVIAASPAYGVAETAQILTKLEFGHVAPLILAIPFLSLYSYKRTHKNSSLDIIITIVGLACSALVYIEWVFQLLTRF